MDKAVSSSLMLLFMFAVTFAILVIPVFMLWWSWNLVMHGLFNLPHLDFYQAMAVTVLLSFFRSTVNVMKNT